MNADRKSDNSGLPDAPVSERAREEAIFKAVSAFNATQLNQGASTHHAVRTGLSALLFRRDFQAVTATALLLILATPVGLSLLHSQQNEVAEGGSGKKASAKEAYAGVSEPSAEQTPVKNAETGDTRKIRDSASAEKSEFAAAKKEAPLKNALPSGSDSVHYFAEPPEPDFGRRFAVAPAPDSADRNVDSFDNATRSKADSQMARAFLRRKDVAADKPRIANDPSYQRAFPETQVDVGRYGSPAPAGNRDRFANAQSNGFRQAVSDGVSTFSIDADTASYSYMHAALADNALPRPDAVRTEELINYFPYDYAAPPSANEPFAADVSVMPHPWAEGRKLMRIGIKGYQLVAKQRPPANLVFLIDTSGSMEEPNKLPLLLKSLSMFVETLSPADRVAIVAYAGSAGVILEPTQVLDRQKILASLNRLSAGGSTAGGEGLALAYRLAKANYNPEAVNRVMLATDGDFNVGISSDEGLKGFVERERQSGIFLSVLGFGMGNLNDSLMQTLAQNGNGVAAHIDTLAEARKVLVEEASSSLFPIAKDVKIQVEFNPATVSEYRLVGYETRLLKQEDFNNDRVDAGEVGSGASVTAVYDIVPKGVSGHIDDRRYSSPAQTSDTNPGAAKSDEYAFLKIRYKLPASQTSTLMTRPITLRDEVKTFAQAPQSARFAVAVAGFGELLRGNGQMGDVTFDSIIQLANAAKGDDNYGYRAEFVSLVRAAKTAKTLPSE